MEENLFPRPAVRRALRDQFIQCWLHMDHKDASIKEANLKLQKTYVGSPAIPALVILDPSTRKALRRHDWPMNETEILAFFRGE